MNDLITFEKFVVINMTEKDSITTIYCHFLAMTIIVDRKTKLRLMNAILCLVSVHFGFSRLHLFSILLTVTV